MKRYCLRLIICLNFTLPWVVLSVIAVKADSGQTVGEPPDSDCYVCHEAISEAWASSAHGQAVSDPAFKEAWQAKSEPKECLACHTTGYDQASGTWQDDGVTCQACHSPASDEHPKVPMPVDRSGKLCGNCHADTYFEWQVSQHGQVDLTCMSCHSQHTTALKAEDASSLCASCHGTRASKFAHSEHYKQSLSCADCHLDSATDFVGEGHGKRGHTFAVSLDTCAECHAYQIHNPGDIPSPQITSEDLNVITSASTVTVTQEPTPASPFGFIALSGMIGLGIGMIAVPWLEHWYQQMKQE